MKAIHRLGIAAVAALLLWAGVAHQVSQRPEASGYLRTALQVAAAAHNSAASGVLVGREQLRRHVTAAYTAAAIDDALTAVAGAQRTLASALAPDDASVALRDRLTPLVQATADQLSDLATAPDDAALADAVHALAHTDGQLTNLMEEYQ